MCNDVGNGVTSAFVTVPPTRPDPTRPITTVQVVCGVSGTTSIDLAVGLDSPPQTWMETDGLEALDWQPACEYGPHEELGHTAPIAWAVWLRATPCGCGADGRFRLHCDPCFRWWTTVPLECYCGLTYRADAILIRAEPIA